MTEIRSLIEESVPTSRLGRWLMQNRVEFEAATAGVRPRWEVLAIRFAKARLISVPAEFWDEEDTPARQLARKRAAEAVRQVWNRVKRRPAGRNPAAKSAPIPTLSAAPPAAGGGHAFAPARSKKPIPQE
jgi:hypothetical protein